MKRLPLVIAAIGLSAIALPSVTTRHPLLVWNASPSVPIGFYRVVARPPPCGALALIRLAAPFRTLADGRGYVPAAVPIIKPIAACNGDTVCRLGGIVSINGQTLAVARNTDASGRRLPRWQGCRRLDATTVFVISRQPHSFDSRYFGPVDRNHVIGLAIPLWTLAAHHH
jgi:conjugative transfer signal peptidase TraF